MSALNKVTKIACQAFSNNTCTKWCNCVNDTGHQVLVTISLVFLQLGRMFKINNIVNVSLKFSHFYNINYSVFDNVVSIYFDVLTLLLGKWYFFWLSIMVGLEPA